MILFQYRNTTASACDNYLICIDQGLNCLNLNNTDRIRCRYNSSESLTRFFYYIVTFLTFCCGILCRHISSKHLSRCIKCFIIRVYRYLCQDRTDSTENASVQKLCADCILKVISDISLAHSRTYGHWGLCVIGMAFAKLIQCCMDHAQLRCITMCDRYLISFFDQICDHAC